MAATENITIPTNSDVSSIVMHKLHHAQSTLSGAQSLFKASCNWESVDSLNQVSMLMDAIRKQLAEALKDLDESACEYDLKQNQAVPSA